MEHLRDMLLFKDDSDFTVTYKLNKVNGIFNWYPYTEGFSKPFVDKMLDYFGASTHSLIMDPFSGCGTTALACTLRSTPSISIEVNPFMNFVGKTKTESLVLDMGKLKEYHKKILDEIKISNKKDLEVPSFIKDKPFFDEDNLNEALMIKNAILRTIKGEPRYCNFFLLHLSSILVKISNMIRAVDLRYRKNKQGKLDVLTIYTEKIEKAFNDLNDCNLPSETETLFFNEDICNISDDLGDYTNKVDFFITSPPYLNGTNYDRNTKLEMGFLNLIKNDMDLHELRTKMVIAGINSTHTKNVYRTDLSFINSLIEEVKKHAYDRRIPIMVHGYFNDMAIAIQNISKLMKPGGKGVIVIGDSQFGGVHIETDLILARICEIQGLRVEKIDVVRERRSKNGMKLRESLIFVIK